MTGTLKQQIKTTWLRMLRSGEYQQGVGSLKKDDKYCAMGLLIEAASQFGTDYWKCVDPYNPGVTPSVVGHFADLEGGLGWLDPNQAIRAVDYVHAHHEIWPSWWTCDTASHFTGSSIASMNDGGFTFSAIADIVEEAL